MITIYSPAELEREVQAPWGYYQPMEEGTLEHAGRRVLYTLGCACIEASCCGKGSWSYARVEGYLVGGGPGQGGGAGAPVQVDTVDELEQKVVIVELLMEKHPGVRVEFR